MLMFCSGFQCLSYVLVFSWQRVQLLDLVVVRRRFAPSTEEILHVELQPDLAVAPLPYFAIFMFLCIFDPVS